MYTLPDSSVPNATGLSITPASGANVALRKVNRSLVTGTIP
jgi:hypothetical protein